MAKVEAAELVGVVSDPHDARDRQYYSPLVSLPSEYPAPDPDTTTDAKGLKDFLRKYSPLVRDQVLDGPCTGYALAGMINFLKWSSGWRAAFLAGTKTIGEIPSAKDTLPVSGEMLYHVAGMYKTGSSYSAGLTPREVMKAWRKHGACLETFWPKKLDHDTAPAEGWQASCADCTIAAYYRVYKGDTFGRRHISDIQAAIYETGAVFAGAKIVFEDWKSLRDRKLTEVPVLPAFPQGLNKEKKEELPGHAYALVGYNSTGFIVLNSWGVNWGYHGFAIIKYEDWAESGEDVWVAALGVPTVSVLTRSPEGPRVHVTSSSCASGAGREQHAGSVVRHRGFGEPDPVLEANSDAWSLERAYNHSVVIADDGMALNRLLEMPSGLRALERVCYDNVLEAFASNTALKEIMVFANGSLEPEEIALRRAAVLGPFFYENGIYPIFVSVQSGFMEPLGQMLLSGVNANRSILGPSMDAAMDNIVEAWTQAPGETSEARDAQIEQVCIRLIRPLWTQFKSDADTATTVGGALYEITRDLAKLMKHIKVKPKRGQRRAKPGIHLVAHSAGAVLIGELLSVFRSRGVKAHLQAGLKAASCTLFAPACSISFAERKFARAVTDKVLKWSDFHVELLSDENERRDNVANIYGKSFLYLLSRALEKRRRTPILGLHKAWSGDQDGLAREFGVAGALAVKSWLGRASGVKPRLHTDPQIEVSPGREHRDAAHDLFDNNVPLITRTIKRISGLNKLRKEVGTLKGF